MIYKSIIPLVLLFLMAGCGKSVLPPAAYTQWVESPEHGLKQSKEIGGVQFELQYKPADYIIACENAQQQLAASFHQERKQKLGELLYFTLALKSGSQDLLMYNLADEKEYLQRVNYYSLDFQQDIKLVVGNDTLPCLLYQFENTYGIAPFVRMSIAFTGKKKEAIASTGAIVLVNDRVFGGGVLPFAFDNDHFESIPEIESN